MKTKKMISLGLASLVAMGTLVGCSGGGKNGSGNRTQLKIGVFNGGLGYAWAEKLEKQFEEKYANVSFEAGKTGVDVIINPQKDLFKVEAIQSAIQQNSSAEDIYYTCYNFYKEFANSGLALNLNDIINEKVYLANGELADMTYNPETKAYELASGEAPTVSMLDKLDEGYKKEFYYDDNKSITAGYYALPYETSLTGFIYDYDLFKEKGWLSYSGVDGVPDTTDDFLDLLERIKQAGMIAYIPGPSNYWEGFQTAFMAQYEGLEGAELNYTYDGEYTFPAGSLPADVAAAANLTANQDGSYTVTISPANAWLLAYQPGKVKYINYMRDIIETDYFDTNVYQASYDYLTIQNAFILSKAGKPGQKRIAMIYEGEWWENEARVTFGSEYGKRDFRIMPMPYIDGQKDATVRTVGSAGAGTDFIVNAKTSKVELCKLWLHFQHSESALETFTLTNGATRNAFKYDLSAEQQQQLTPFARNIYQIKKAEGAYANIKTAYTGDYTSCHPFYNNTPMGGFGSYISSTVFGGEYGSWAAVGTSLAGYFLKNAGLTNPYAEAQPLIDGMYEYYNKAMWDQRYKLWQPTNG